MMKYYGDSDVGKIRKLNEDSYVLEKLSDDCLLAVIADGMGGYQGGKKASEIASETIKNCIKLKLGKFSRFSERSFKKLLSDSVSEANSNVYELSRSDKLLNGMGTTAVICLIYKNTYYAANVGDSRMYLYDNGFNQITKDHSYVNELVTLGLISENEARVHPNKNVITRAVGTEKKVESDFFTGNFDGNKKIFMCSDGLSNMLPFDEISEVISKNDSVDRIVNKLIKKANDNGGKDNITAILISNENEGGENV